MIIGITGNSGTGKTEISKILAKKINAEIINADEVVREMTSTDTEYLKKIMEIFGENIVENHQLNRQKLAQIIYFDSDKKNKLNQLTFKYVVEEIKHKITQQKDNTIIDAPLLFESGLNKICDYTISIISNREIKIQRICNRDNISKEIAEARLNIQKDDNFYISQSDFVIENNSELNEINLEEICIKIGMN